jgi:diketogulonate reductase-like aldo/keto reductase
MAMCGAFGVVFEGYCPLGKGEALHHPLILAISKTYGKTAAQVLIRWSLQHGVVTIPKSTRPDRIRENCNVFDFALSDADVARIDLLHCNLRVTWDPTGIR